MHMKQPLPRRKKNEQMKGVARPEYGRENGTEEPETDPLSAFIHSFINSTLHSSVRQAQEMELRGL